MQMHLYEVTFDTKKGGYTSWVRYIYAHSATAAKAKLAELWDEGPLHDMHMFHVSARQLLVAEWTPEKDFAIREHEVVFYMDKNHDVCKGTLDHGSPYTHGLIRKGVKRYEAVWTDSGGIVAPGIGRKYTLWCVRDCEDAIVAYDWEVES